MFLHLVILFINYNVILCHPKTVKINGLEIASQWWVDDWVENKEPEFLKTQQNFTFKEGESAVLPCQVQNLGYKTISWIRVKELTVIAVDRMIVTTDNRFSVSHNEKSEEFEEWNLMINKTELKDSGIYDCQINTHPKKSTKIYLQILPFVQIQQKDEAPEAKESSMPKWIGVKEGDRLNMRCEAKLGDEDIILEYIKEDYRHLSNFDATSTSSNLQIDWYFEDELLDHHYEMIGIKELSTQKSIISELLIQNINSNLAGEYRCQFKSLHSEPITVRLFNLVKSKSEHQPELWESSEITSNEVNKANRDIAYISGALLFLICFVHFFLCIPFNRRPA